MEDIIERTVRKIEPLNEKVMAAARARQDILTKPQGSLGRLEALSVQIAGIQGKTLPEIKNKAIITMAGDHGVIAQGVSNWPQEVTAQMVYNFLEGGAAINVIGRQIGARIIVVDMGVASSLQTNKGLLSRKVDFGTRDMLQSPAMTMDQAIQAVATGIEVVNAEIDNGLDIVGTGDMGIGNTTASSAICAVMTGNTVSTVTGRGAGLNDDQLNHKINIIERAISHNRPDQLQPLDVLSKVGGFEIGGLIGVMLGAAARHVPVVIDGFISGAAALIAVGISSLLKNYLIPAHLSVESGHPLMMNYLELKPLLDLKMRLGEGTGAALGIFLAETAVRILNEMSTFGEAGVTDEKLEAA